VTCATCGTPIEPKAGPGRPAAYCSVGCRRVAEFQIRNLARRVERYELEQREVKAGNHAYYDDSERQRRLRALRRWIKTDNAKLRAILGANNQVQSKEGGGG